MRTEIKTAMILGVSIAVAIGVISVFFSSLETKQMADDTSVIGMDKSKFKKAPQLVGISDYINTTREQLDSEIEGKVVLYDIWTYSCINCIRTLPYITAWNDKYSEQGLLIIGIHSPEFEFEKNIENVEMAVSKFGINYPVVLDNDLETWKAFENRYWPRKYIADHEGYIRYDHIGEGKYQETEKAIQELLKERAMSLGLNTASAEQFVDIQEFDHAVFRTPELYFGYKFAVGRNQLGNSEGFVPEQEVVYVSPDSKRLHYFYLDGIWKNQQDSMVLVSDNGTITLPYSGKEVNIVTGGKADLQIIIDGKNSSDIFGVDVKDGRLQTSYSGLYNIVKSQKSEEHVLEILVTTPGFEIFTFTFG